MTAALEYITEILGDDDPCLPESEDDAVRQLIESHRRQREIITAIPVRRPCLWRRVIWWLKWRGSP